MGTITAVDPAPAVETPSETKLEGAVPSLVLNDNEAPTAPTEAPAAESEPVEKKKSMVASLKTKLSRKKVQEEAHEDTPAVPVTQAATDEPQKAEEVAPEAEKPAKTDKVEAAEPSPSMVQRLLGKRSSHKQAEAVAETTPVPATAEATSEAEAPKPAVEVEAKAVVEATPVTENTKETAPKSATGSKFGLMSRFSSKKTEAPAPTADDTASVHSSASSSSSSSSSSSESDAQNKKASILARVTRRLPRSKKAVTPAEGSEAKPAPEVEAATEAKVTASVAPEAEVKADADTEAKSAPATPAKPSLVQTLKAKLARPPATPVAATTTTADAAPADAAPVDKSPAPGPLAESKAETSTLQKTPAKKQKRGFFHRAASEPAELPVQPATITTPEPSAVATAPVAEPVAEPAAAVPAPPVSASAPSTPSKRFSLYAFRKKNEHPVPVPTNTDTALVSPDPSTCKTFKAKFLHKKEAKELSVEKTEPASDKPSVNQASEKKSEKLSGEKDTSVTTPPTAVAA